METQKILNFLNGSDNENSKFETKEWHVIDSESKDNYSHLDLIKCLTKSIGSSLCDYSDAYISGNIMLQELLLLLLQVLILKENNHLMQLHKYYLKIVQHLKNTLQKLMVLLLMKLILLILHCLCTI